MDNPWKSIRLSDYENHMKSDTVMQLQTLNGMMNKQLNTYPADNVMILGVAGGNGLENIRDGKYKTVYGVDVNPEYLHETEKRYKSLRGILKCICTDLTLHTSDLPSSDLLIADLIIEYIGYDRFQDVVKRVKPRYVSCGIQINCGSSFVSESKYKHSFDGLSRVHHQVEAGTLTRYMNEIGYNDILTIEYDLPYEKKLVQIDYEKIT